MNRSFAALSAVTVLALAVPAFAQQPKPAAAAAKEADTLYNDGVALMKDGKFADACPKLEKSNKLDPGVGVMLWLANCYEKVGKTASAYRQYVEAEQLAGETKDNREKVALKHAQDLEPKLSKLIITLPDEHIDGIEVRRDGDVVKSFGEAITTDPGSHLVEASAPGYKHWESKVDVPPDGATASVTAGPLEKEEPKVDETAPPPPPPPSGGSWTPLRIGGLVTAGVGVVGLGVGSAFGLLAKSSLDDSNSNNHCDATDHCDAQGLALRSDAQSSALLSTVSFIAGGVLVAGGLTMFFLAPKEAPEQKAAPLASLSVVPAISPSFSGMAALGRF